MPNGPYDHLVESARVYNSIHAVTRRQETPWCYECLEHIADPETGLCPLCM